MVLELVFTIAVLAIATIAVIGLSLSSRLVGCFFALMLFYTGKPMLAIIILFVTTIGWVFSHKTN